MPDFVKLMSHESRPSLNSCLNIGPPPSVVAPFFPLKFVVENVAGSFFIVSIVPSYQHLFQPNLFIGRDLKSLTCGMPSSIMFLNLRLF